LLAFAGPDADAAGELRAALETAGKPIGAYELLIAGQALHHKLTLVTANLKEFARVKGLVREDWAKA
jgi:tRNA(fMet)-specific endonuclease VapC